MKTKTCVRCKEALPVSQFAWKDKSRGYLSSWCKQCHREYDRTHYRENKAYYKAKGARSRKKAKKQAMKFLRQYLDTHPCVDCGESDTLVLEFDHVKGKGKDVASMTCDSIEKIKEELKRCEVRCANCHRRRHLLETETWRK